MPRPALAVVGWWVAVVTAFPAFAGWAERAERASLVVVARCERRDSQWENGAIHSYSTLALRRVIRGEPSGDLVVRQPGGTVGPLGQRVSDSKLLEPGTTYLLFLKRDETSSWTTTGAGASVVETAADGTERVGRADLESVLREIEDAR